MKTSERSHGSAPDGKWVSLVTIVAMISLLLLTVMGLRAEVIQIRAAYLVLLVFVVAVSGIEIYRDGFPGFFSPAVWTTIGFIYFLIIGPILYPSNLISVSEPQELPYYFAILSIGIASYFAGIFISREINLSIRISKFEEMLNVSSVFNKTILTIAVYFAMNYLIAYAGEYEFFEYITLNAYLLGEKEQIFSRFDGGYGYYLLLFSRYFPLIITLPSTHLIRQEIPRWKKAVLIAGLLFVFTITLFAGGRMRLAIWLGGIGAYLVLNWSRTRDFSDLGEPIRKLGPIVLTSGLILFLLTTLQIGFRNQRANLGAETIDLGEALFDNLLDDRTDQNYTLYHAVIADREGSLEHLWGESYALTFVAYIPRAIWPEKPGGDSMYEKLEVINPWGTNQNITHSVIGELIYNFGISAVLPGMILFGFLQGQVFNQFQRYKTNTRMILLYAALVIPFAFFVRGEFHSTAGSVFYSFVGLLFVLW